MPSLDAVLFVLTPAAALGCAVLAGIFLAFSNFVMRALARIPPAAGMLAMQSINVVVLNPMFLALFFGTAAACLVLVVLAVWRWPAPGTTALLVGGILYVVGTFVVTVAFNVPRNKSLAQINASASDSVAPWRNYVSGWTRWHHVRTISALAASGFLSFALSRI